ncbi:MAG: hypothetical protein J6P64_01535 [Bacteroidales bacterium]|nr:hypothetical protein [Bacteroidales bacterium]
MVQQTSFDDYFIEGDPMLVKTNEFKANFGNDYFIGILTECDDHFTKENLTILRELGNELLDSLSYADKITSLVDLEFMLGSDDGMEIVQIVPDEIPETGSPEMEQIRSLAYSKPHVARKLISKDGKNAWTLLKLRAFPSEEEWKKTGDVSVPFGNFVFRGEMADYIDDHGNHLGNALAGLDWYPGADWNVQKI